MRAGAEGEEVKGRTAWSGCGVSPREGSVGLERRAEERWCGVMEGLDADGLNRSWEWTLWCGKHLS